MNYKQIFNNEEIRAYYKKGDMILGKLGYTDHSVGHATIVADKAASIMQYFQYSEHDVELARISGFMHDIGNALNRNHHAEYGALLAGDILRETDMSLEDRITVMAAIANHDESTGTAIDPVSAALIIADKTDVRRNRVRAKEMSQFDQHDRVNYAVIGQNLQFNGDDKTISLNLQIDESICTMFDYFEIFLNRMLMCRRAAEVLGVDFRVKANGQKVL
ncbi:MAG: HD domain-containing protein [Oscillospiraceae bacterium]|jgi:metal-dependent HD superfamily phosphatase/phosphodiesterase